MSGYLHVDMRAHYKYPDGSDYDGEWNKDGQRHGLGRMTFPDNSRFVGCFENGMCDGLGVMLFKDGSRWAFAPNILNK